MVEEFLCAAPKIRGKKSEIWKCVFQGVVPKAEKSRKEYEVHGSEKHKAAESREERNSEKSNEKYGAEDSRGSIFPYRWLHVVAPIVTESASLLLVFSKWLKHRNVAIQTQSSNFLCACA